MKRTLFSLLVTFAVLAALAALVASFRLPLARAAIELAATANGIAHPELTVSRFGPDGLEITGFSGGTDAAVRIARIEIAWSPESLARMRAERIDIDAPHLRAEIADAGVSIVGIDLPDKAEDPAGGIALPADRINIADAQLDLVTPHGPVSVNGSGHLDSPPGGQVDGQLAIVARGDPASVEIAAIFAGPSLDTLQLDLTVRGGAVDIPQAVIGNVTGDVDLALVDGVPADGRLSLVATGLAISAVPGGLRGDLQLDGNWQAATGTLRAAFTEFEGERGLSVVADLSEVAFADNRLSAIAAVDARADRIATPNATMRGVSVALPLDIVTTRNRTVIRLTTDALLSAQNVDMANLAQTREPLVATLHPTDQPLAVVTTDDAALSVVYAVDVALDRAAIDLTATHAARRSLSLSGATLQAGGNFDAPNRVSGAGTLRAAHASVTAPDLEIRDLVAGIAVSGPAPTLSLDVTAARLRDGASPPRFTPLDIAGTAEHRTGRTSFEGTLRDTTGAVRATLRGSWPPSGRADAVSLDVPPLDFTPGGLQPAALVPALAAFDKVSGRIAGQAQLGGASDALQLRAEGKIDDLTFEFAGIAVEGVSTGLALSGPGPLTTPESQVLTIRKIDTPAPLENLRAVYRLYADDFGRPTVEIDDLTGNLLGGTLSIKRVRLDPDLETAERPMELPVDIASLDLPALFRLIDTEGLDGTGSLSGRIPILLSADTVEIEGAELSADGDGVLRIRSQAASQFLAAQGESVDLVLRALDDFRYSELTIAIDREAGGEARVVLSLLGHNPAVLEGHPFRFNITVNSNVDELLAALLRGYRIATQSLERPAAK